MAGEAARMAMKFRHRRRTEDPEINLIPFIDVLLVVLIFLVRVHHLFAKLHGTARSTLPAANESKSMREPARARSSCRWLVRRPLRHQQASWWKACSVEVLMAELTRRSGQGDDDADRDHLGRRHGCTPERSSTCWTQRGALAWSAADLRHPDRRRRRPLSTVPASRRLAASRLECGQWLLAQWFKPHPSPLSRVLWPRGTAVYGLAAAPVTCNDKSAWPSAL